MIQDDSVPKWIRTHEKKKKKNKNKKIKKTKNKQTNKQKNLHASAVEYLTVPSQRGQFTAQRVEKFLMNETSRNYNFL